MKTTKGTFGGPCLALLVTILVSGCIGVQEEGSSAAQEANEYLAVVLEWNVADGMLHAGPVPTDLFVPWDASPVPEGSVSVILLGDTIARIHGGVVSASDRLELFGELIRNLGVVLPSPQENPCAPDVQPGEQSQFSWNCPAAEELFRQQWVDIARQHLRAAGYSEEEIDAALL